MSNPIRHSEEDLVQMMQMYFHLMAENMAELAARNPDKSIIKLRATVQGFEVSGAVQAKNVVVP